MEKFKLSTVIYASEQDVYDVLVDFEGYPQFCNYVERVSARGDGDEGTEYGIEFGWWKISYTAWSRVETLEPPTRIDWELTKDIDADGSWIVEDITSEVDGDHDVATRVTIDVNYEVTSSGSKILDLPMFFSFDRIVKQVKPLIFEESRSILQSLVGELEGTPRTPEITVHETPRHFTQSDIERISE